MRAGDGDGEKKHCWYLLGLVVRERHAATAGSRAGSSDTDAASEANEGVKSNDGRLHDRNIHHSVAGGGKSEMAALAGGGWKRVVVWCRKRERLATSNPGRLRPEKTPPENRP